MEKRYSLSLLTHERTASRSYLRLPLRLLKWALAAALIVELTSFLVITASNYILYGSPREGSGVRYDGVHMTDTGREMVAAGLARALEERGLLAGTVRGQAR